MKLSSREKKLLIVLLVLIIAVVVYMYVVTPIHDENALLIEEKNTIQNELNSVKAMVKDESAIDSMIENYKERLALLDQKLPYQIHLEKVINDMFMHFNSYDITVNSVSFNMQDPSKDSGNLPKEGGIENLRPALSPSEIIEAYENGESITVEDKKEEEENKAAVVESKIGRLMVNLSFKSNYDVFKDALNGLNNMDSTIITMNSTISKIEPDLEELNPDINEVFVNLSLAIPFYYDNEELENIFFDYEFKPGKGFKEHGPFEYKDILKGTLGGEELNFSSIQGQFDIILKDKASDVAAQSFSTVGVSNSTLSLDGNKAESYVLSLIESNGKVMYKYKNSVKSFPEKGYKTLNMDMDKDFIIIRVDSMSRIGSKDKAGLNLTLNNKTDKKVVFYVFDDDKKSPRFNVSVKSGSYDIIRN